MWWQLRLTTSSAELFSRYYQRHSCFVLCQHALYAHSKTSTTFKYFFLSKHIWFGAGRTYNFSISCSQHTVAHGNERFYHWNFMELCRSSTNLLGGLHWCNTYCNGDSGSTSWENGRTSNGVISCIVKLKELHTHLPSDVVPEIQMHFLNISKL